MNPDELQSYDEGEVQEILRLAGVARRRMDYFTREDMVRAAAELDVPESAIIQAEQLVRERQSEADDRAEYRRKQGRELTKGVCIGVPVLTIIIFGHAFHMFGNFFSLGKGILKPLGGLLFSRSTQHELDFQDWRNKRYRKVMNIPEPGVTLTHKTVWNTDIGQMIRHGVPKPPADYESKLADGLIWGGACSDEAERVFVRAPEPASDAGHQIEGRGLNSIRPGQ